MGDWKGRRGSLPRQNLIILRMVGRWSRRRGKADRGIGYGRTRAGIDVFRCRLSSTQFIEVTDIPVVYPQLNDVPSERQFRSPHSLLGVRSRKGSHNILDSPNPKRRKSITHSLDFEIVSHLHLSCALHSHRDPIGRHFET